jgi:hypothetical protein
VTAWHFAFTIVPKTGILRVHGKQVDTLEYMAALDKSELSWPPFVAPYSAETFADIDYWQGEQNKLSRLHRYCQSLEFKKIDDLSSESWSTYMRSDWATEFKLQNSEPLIRFNVQNLEFNILDLILLWLQANDCLLVLFDNGRVLPPDRQIVLDALLASNAMRLSLARAEQMFVEKSDA